MTDVPLPAPGDTNWNDWASEQEDASDQVRDLIGGDLERTYATRGRALLGRLADPNQGLPALSTDLPTHTWGTASTLTRLVSPMSGEINILGAQGTWDDSQNKLVVDGSYSALDFTIFGTSVEIGFVEQVADGARLWIHVDGRPITSAPSLGLTTGAGGIYYTKLVWGASARRRITVHAAGLNGWNGVYLAHATAISPGPELPRIAFVGDSFFAGSTPSPMLQASAFRMAQLLGVDPVIASVGGTGYVTGGDTFGSAGRVAKVTEKAPDLIVFSGSVNDPVSGLQAAAAACFATYASALPDVPCIVFGPQPSEGSVTIGSTRAQAIAAVKAAADAAPNVSAFFDMVGTAAGTVPPAYSSFTTYNLGDLVTYLGSVYRWAGATGSTGPYSPYQYSRWTLQTYAYTGTGRVGTTAGDGNRDFYLASDSIHPTTDGATALALRQEADIRATLGA